MSSRKVLQFVLQYTPFWMKLREKSKSNLLAVLFISILWGGPMVAFFVPDKYTWSQLMCQITLWIWLHLKASCWADPCIVRHYLIHLMLIFCHNNDKKEYLLQTGSALQGIEFQWKAHCKNDKGWGKLTMQPAGAESSSPHYHGHTIAPRKHPGVSLPIEVKDNCHSCKSWKHEKIHRGKNETSNCSTEKKETKNSTRNAK